MDLIDALLWKGRILLFSPSAIPMGDVINWAYDEGHSLKTSRMFGFLHPFMLSAAMRIVRTNLTIMLKLKFHRIIVSGGVVE